MSSSDKVAVLVSGGMDSSVLLSTFLKQGFQVFPVYIKHGLLWESVELEYLAKYLATVQQERLAPLQILDLPVVDLYDAHWSLSGENVPDEYSEDEAVYLPGRNLLLLAKMGVWCSLRGIHKVALASLKGNPFSDNSDEFYQSMSKSIEIALGWPVEILRPFSKLSKSDVIKTAAGLPLALTFSCIKPINHLHCGHCNKCAERKLAYQLLGLADETKYFN